ncbi:Uncharacterized conserved protein, DUF58 family, contains vWF domain [Paenibacillus sp. UNCCL117]|uniref:DUF58 domain-containing protein n=1 Tax=unclassified Paenibacillus TaxID=185978 RepID=UPI00088F9F88|nr:MULTISPECIES: DUF58 domain-containing protein [unclassified Paenibacillus]SDD40389.1 Uncharacterized conserved protein, DUF58 family, contains vWF domain [Paenibacillus sp. cl123]SFW48111.1 Uncharacterized conserved protein, DUF58 family, contains vWF domain [Paenibacillus sp. UNCCL117]
MTTSSGKRWGRFRYLAERLERRLIVPTPRLAAAAGLGALLVAAGYAAGAGAAALAAVNLALAAASVLDLSLLPRRGSIRVSRTLPGRADVGSPFEVKLTVTAPRALSSGLLLQAADDVPGTFRLHERQTLRTYWEGKETSLTYTAAGQERGTYAFRRIWIRFSGRLGLWSKQMNVRMEQSIRIYPDMSAVRGVLSAAQRDLILDGRRVYKRERTGSEFHAIREYTPDDDPRLINWRASARARSLMTNQFRPERGKVVTIMLDCGRRMGVELAGRTKLDAALEAALALAAVALKQGDKVALLAFSSRIKAYVPPGAGLAHLQTLTEAVFDLESEFVEASYLTALQHLMRVQSKRGLTLLFSDLDNAMFDEQLQPLLQRLRRQHHVLLLGLRDEVLYGWTVIGTAGRREAYVKSLAHKFALDRRELAARLAASGIEVVDVPVSELAWTAVNRYLAVKADDLV